MGIDGFCVRNGMKAKVAQRDGEAGSPIAGAGIGTWKKERVEILSLGLWGSII